MLNLYGPHSASKVLFLVARKGIPSPNCSSSFRRSAFRQQNALPRREKGHSAAKMLSLVPAECISSANCRSTFLDHLFLRNSRISRIYLEVSEKCAIFAANFHLNTMETDRATWHDYRAPGYYMLTLTAEDRASHPFGSLIGNGEEEAAIKLSSLGEILRDEIESQPRRHPELDIVAYVIMPDHCHICLHIQTAMRDHLGKVVWGIKYGTTVGYLSAMNAQTGRTCLVEGGTSMRRGVVATSDAVPVLFVPPLWAQGYHDRVVKHKGQVAVLKRYIQRNPARLWIKQHSDRTLMSVVDVFLPLALPLAQGLKDFAIYCDEHRGGRSLSSYQLSTSHPYARSYVELLGKTLRKVKSSASETREVGLRLRVCGNRNLLQSGRPFERVRISRSVTPAQLEAEIERLMSLCEHEGTVLVSPFVSWSEKVVLRLLRHHHYPHIVVDDASISTFYKPMDAVRAVRDQALPPWWRGSKYEVLLRSVPDRSDLQCVEAGELLLLHPWYDRPVSDKTGKAEMELMNELCRTLCEALSQAPSQ